jgi:hypothetical protein
MATDADREWATELIAIISRHDFRRWTVWKDSGKLRCFCGQEFNLPHCDHLMEKHLADAILDALAKRDAEPKGGETSDGHHTFKELYQHRYALFCVVCATYDGWKSKTHSDGTMFDGHFIAGVETPLGQATYHLPLSWWDCYRVRELEHAPLWDGHTSKQVLERINALLREKRSENGADREWARQLAMGLGVESFSFDEAADIILAALAKRDAERQPVELSAEDVRIASNRASAAAKGGLPSFWLCLAEALNALLREKAHNAQKKDYPFLPLNRGRCTW